MHRVNLRVQRSIYRQMGKNDENGKKWKLIFSRWVHTPQLKFQEVIGFLHTCFQFSFNNANLWSTPHSTTRKTIIRNSSKHLIPREVGCSSLNCSSNNCTSRVLSDFIVKYCGVRRNNENVLKSRDCFHSAPTHVHLARWGVFDNRQIFYIRL